MDSEEERYPRDYRAERKREVTQGAASSLIYFNIYVEDLAREAEKWTGGAGQGRGAVVLVADEVFIQAAIKNCTGLAGCRVLVEREEGSTGVSEKFVFLQLPNGEKNEEVFLDREGLKVTGTEKYLGIALNADGLRAKVSAGRTTSVGPETTELSNSRCFSLAL